jgi:hypothetical protein
MFNDLSPGCQAYQMGKGQSLQIIGIEKTGCLYGTDDLIPYTKLTSKLIKELNIRLNITKLL